MTTHITPGPWHDDNDREYTSRRVIRHNGVIVAVISEPTAGLSVDEVGANATAIAALPELLAVALEIAQSHCDLGDSERRIRLYHALMKAGVPEYQPIRGGAV